MFEKYTEKARRVVFFARYEVNELGASAVATEHLLLGLLREDQTLISRFLPSSITVDRFREQIKKRTTIRERILKYREIPLSDESENILKSAVEEATHLSQKQINVEHILLALLREKNSLAAKILNENGVKYSVVHKEFEIAGN